MDDYYLLDNAIGTCVVVNSTDLQLLVLLHYSTRLTLMNCKYMHVEGNFLTITLHKSSETNRLALTALNDIHSFMRKLLSPRQQLLWHTPYTVHVH